LRRGKQVRNLRNTKETLEKVTEDRQPKEGLKRKYCKRKTGQKKTKKMFGPGI